MTRKSAREAALHALYTLTFHPEYNADDVRALTSQSALSAWAGDCSLYDDLSYNEEAAYLQEVVEGVWIQSRELEAVIEKHSANWRIDRITRISLTLMKMALFEPRAIKGVTTAIAVNEAVELCKRYDSEEAAAFINGVLGAASRAESPQ